MEKKQKSIMNYSLAEPSMMDEDDHNRNSQFSSSSAIDHLIRSSSSTKRRRSPIIHESAEFFSNHLQLLHHENPLPRIISQKRPAHDHSSIQEYGQHTHKRARHEQTTNSGLENQPPSAKVSRRSLFLCHPRSEANHLPVPNEIPSSFNQLFPSLSSPSRINNTSNHPYEPNLSQYFLSPSEHWTNQPIEMFTTHPSKSMSSMTLKTIQGTNDKTIGKSHIRLASSSSNLLSPLRATNFVLDSNQQTMSATIMRTGNISPAHSDTSTESTSTCSSDEQQFQPNFLSLRYHQPSRSNRERENYEQLLDLAEKLADPNRYDQVDIEQFASYRYKSIPAATKTAVVSKQTACVICMSHFKNGQHIRVLPCQHEYHSKCIARWFTMNSSCPICRRDNFLLTH